MEDQMPKSLQLEEGGSMFEVRLFACRLYGQYGGCVGFGISAEEAERQALEHLASTPEMDLDPTSELMFDPNNKYDVSDFIYGFKEAAEKRREAQLRLRAGLSGEMYLFPRGTTHAALNQYGGLHYSANGSNVGPLIELKFANGNWIAK